jgi:hypothetical protein
MSHIFTYEPCPGHVFRFKDLRAQLRMSDENVSPRVIRVEECEKCKEQRTKDVGVLRPNLKVGGR